MTSQPTRTALNGTTHPSYHLKTEVSVMFRFQPCSTHYTAVQINSCSNSSVVMKVITMKNTDDFQ